MSNMNFPGRKGGRCVRLTTSPPSRTECHENWESKPPETLWATPGLLQDSFTYIVILLPIYAQISELTSFLHVLELILPQYLSNK